MGWVRLPLPPHFRVKSIQLMGLAFFECGNSSAGSPPTGGSQAEGTLQMRK